MVVIDCSAVIDLLTAGGDVGRALRTAVDGEDLHAPELLDVEVVSSLRTMIRRGALSPARAQDALLDFDDLAVQRWSFGRSLRLRTLQLRDNVSGYDAAYVVLAEAMECPLLTRDARLARAVGHLVDVLSPR